MHKAFFLLRVAAWGDPNLTRKMIMSRLEVQPVAQVYREMVLKNKNDIPTMLAPSFRNHFSKKKVYL